MTTPGHADPEITFPYSASPRAFQRAPRGDQGVSDSPMNKLTPIRLGQISGGSTDTRRQILDAAP